MEDKKSKKNDTIIAICLIGTFLLVFSVMVLKVFLSNPKYKFFNRTHFAYDNAVERYKKDKTKNRVTDGKYTYKIFFSDGQVIDYVAEFNVDDDKLTHLCVMSNGLTLDFKEDNITEEYIKKSKKVLYANKVCSFDD